MENNIPANIIDIIISQTNYNKDTAKEELIKCNGDHIKVIRNYLQKDITYKKCKQHTYNKEPLTLNQEIFKQFRLKFNNQNNIFQTKDPASSYDS